MTTAATSLLGLALPVTGELSGVWGQTVNDSITTLLDSAVAGTTTLSTDADVTLTTTTLASNQARQAILLCSGARTGIKTITAPAQSKIYTIINATTGGYAVKLVGVGPTTGLTIPNGASAVVAWNGSDFIEIGSASVGNFTVNGNLTVTGTSTLTGAATLTANPTLSAGTANGVAYLNGSKVLTTGSALTFSSSTLGVSDGSVTAGNTGVVLTGKYASGFPTSGAGYFQLQTNNSDDTNGGLSVFTLAGGTLRASYRITDESNAGGCFQAWNVAGSERMRLTSTGLGIGTSSPGYKLTVNGFTAVSGTQAAIKQVAEANAFAGIGVQRSANDSTLGLAFNSSADAWQISASYASSGTYKPIQLLTSDTIRVTLDSSGNLGLGVTPSAWQSDSKALDIGAYTSLSNVLGYQATISNNAYYNSGYKYRTSGYVASAFVQASGGFSWLTTSTSGTAGNAISFTQAMTLDASGNLGIGTSSPADKLEVYSIITARASSGTSALRLRNTTTDMQWQSVAGTNAVSLFDNGVGATRLTVDSSGNLLVGVTSGTRNWISKDNAGGYALTINNSNANPIGAQIYHNTDSNGTGNQFLDCQGAANVRAQIRSNGGIANYQANNVNLSDRREKTNFALAGEYLSKICAIPVQTFNYVDQNLEDDPGLTLGVVAQDVQAVAPELVSESNWGTEEEPKMRLSIYQTDLQYALMKCIQEQQAIIEQLKADVAALKGN